MPTSFIQSSAAVSLSLDLLSLTMCANEGKETNLQLPVAVLEQQQCERVHTDKNNLSNIYYCFVRTCTVCVLEDTAENQKKSGFSSFASKGIFFRFLSNSIVFDLSADVAGICTFMHAHHVIVVCMAGSGQNLPPYQINCCRQNILPSFFSTYKEITLQLLHTTVIMYKRTSTT